ncbi:MAG: Nif3-like dinuclear metal center hexameric protein [Lutimonas sp.]
MKIKQITQIIEELSPLAYAEDFDNVGLLVGRPDQTVSGVLVSLDCLEQTVDEAIASSCNLIVSFHPIIFSGLKKLNGSSYVERTVIKAIKNDIAIYAMHTALDNSIHGVSDKMSEVLGLTNRKILISKPRTLKKLSTYVPPSAAEAVRDALFDAGAGNIGNYSHCSFNAPGEGTYLGDASSQPAIGEKEVLQKVSELLITVIFDSHLQGAILKALRDSHPYEEIAFDIITVDNTHPEIGMGMVGELENQEETNAFLARLKSTFGTPVIRHSGLVSKHVKKIAVLGGSGSFGIEQAKAAGADVYVTSDLKYHDFFKAENRILLVDIGHYESEQFTKNLLADYLTKKITNFAPAVPESGIILSKISTNPINYT